MRLSITPDFFELIANHPSVYPYVTCKGFEGRITLGVGGELPNNCLGLEFDTGGFFLVELRPRVYEVHTLFLPKSERVVEKAMDALDLMFPLLADELVTMVPADLPHAKRLALKMGFQFTHRDPDGWERDSGPVDLDHFRLTCTEHMERVRCQSSQPSPQ